ncbi:hypothetical protein RCL1_007629 [Eukaryota sp. TZLM3-RCL]
MLDDVRSAIHFFYEGSDQQREQAHTFLFSLSKSFDVIPVALCLLSDPSPFVVFWSCQSIDSAYSAFFCSVSEDLHSELQEAVIESFQSFHIYPEFVQTKLAVTLARICLLQFPIIWGDPFSDLLKALSQTPSFPHSFLVFLKVFAEEISSAKLTSQQRQKQSVPLAQLSINVVNYCLALLSNSSTLSGEITGDCFNSLEAWCSCSYVSFSDLPMELITCLYSYLGHNDHVIQSIKILSQILTHPLNTLSSRRVVLQALFSIIPNFHSLITSISHDDVSVSPVFCCFVSNCADVLIRNFQDFENLAPLLIHLFNLLRLCLNFTNPNALEFLTDVFPFILDLPRVFLDDNQTRQIFIQIFNTILSKIATSFSFLTSSSEDSKRIYTICYDLLLPVCSIIGFDHVITHIFSIFTQVFPHQNSEIPVFNSESDLLKTSAGIIILTALDTSITNTVQSEPITESLSCVLLRCFLSARHALENTSSLHPCLLYSSLKFLSLFSEIFYYFEKFYPSVSSQVLEKLVVYGFHQDSNTSAIKIGSKSLSDNCQSILIALSSENNSPLAKEAIINHFLSIIGQGNSSVVVKKSCLVIVSKATSNNKDIHFWAIGRILDILNNHLESLLNNIQSNFTQEVYENLLGLLPLFEVVVKQISLTFQSSDDDEIVIDVDDDAPAIPPSSSILNSFNVAFNLFANLVSLNSSELCSIVASFIEQFVFRLDCILQQFIGQIFEILMSIFGKVPAEVIKCCSQLISSSTFRSLPHVSITTDGCTVPLNPNVHTVLHCFSTAFFELNGVPKSFIISFPPVNQLFESLNIKFISDDACIALLGLWKRVVNTDQKVVTCKLFDCILAFSLRQLYSPYPFLVSSSHRFLTDYLELVSQSRMGSAESFVFSQNIISEFVANTLQHKLPFPSTLMTLFLYLKRTNNGLNIFSNYLFGKFGQTEKSSNFLRRIGTSKSVVDIQQAFDEINR